MKSIPVIDVDLTLPPEKRWRHLSAPLRNAGKKLAAQAASEIRDVRLRWLAETMLDLTTVARNPYRNEVIALAKLIGISRREALIANFSYELNQVLLTGLDIWEQNEPRMQRLLDGMRSFQSSTTDAMRNHLRRLFGCTAGAACFSRLNMVHVRTLDWHLEGLGRHSVIWHCIGAHAGEYYSVGWPGFVGVLSGMAPGRFSATINQAMPIGMPSLQIPPAHLLRWVFENCRNYKEALDALLSNPVCFPAFVMLVGNRAGQAAILELTPKENRAHRMVRKMPIAIANDYLSADWRGRCGLDAKTLKPYEKGDQTEHRRNRMLTELNRRNPVSITKALAAVQAEWIENESTMQQMVFIPSTGECLVIGLEDNEPVRIGSVKSQKPYR